MLPRDKVLLFLDVAAKNAQAELDELVQLLTARGVSSEDAECLIAFVPIAFAQVLLSPTGVKFQDSYLIRDLKTGASAQGLLENEPIFESALGMAEQLARSDAASVQRLHSMAAQSAEYGVARELAGHEGDLGNVVLTEPLLVRVPIEHLSKTQRRGWWWFWRRN